MDKAFISRATLLLSGEAVSNPADEHRLIHSLFSREGARDFIFSRNGSSHDGHPRFLVISRSEPQPSSIFSVETKPFDAVFEEGDELRFDVTANPAVNRGRVSKDGKRTTNRVDVVMRAIHSLPTDERGKAREVAVQEAGFAWLKKQGERFGFEVTEHRTEISDYQQLRIPRDNGAVMPVSKLRFTGILTVTDPSLFSQAVVNGIGRCKGFGFGMLKVAA